VFGFFGFGFLVLLTPKDRLQLVHICLAQVAVAFRVGESCEGVLAADLGAGLLVVEAHRHPDVFEAHLFPDDLLLEQ